MIRSQFYWLIPRVLAVLVFLCLKLLLDNNLGPENEIDVLPLAKQFANPNWLPTDWYLNQPPGYRLLFNTLFGKLIVTYGFLATSIIGRLACYAVIALGLVLIAMSLDLSLPFLLLAIGVFLYTGQGVAASEWMLGGLETKTVAYSLVLLALALMLTAKYAWMSLMLGLATSFHILVGGWAFLVVLAWLVLRWKMRLRSVWYLGALLLLYLLTSVLAVKPVLEQLFTKLPPSLVMPSYIYVFLRLPHHLNPLSWSLDKWSKFAVYLLLLALCIIRLWRQPLSHKSSQQYVAQIELFEYTLLSLIPFLLGLAIAPFDAQGSFLQYYPFRLCDVMLPLNTCLLSACALQQTFTGRARQLQFLVCIVLLSGACSIELGNFHQQYLALYRFPEIESEFKALCDWVRTSTPHDATVVSPPANLDEFTWLAERPTIAKFKLLPQTPAGILEWYERLSDLGGGFSWPTTVRHRSYRKEIKLKLTAAYHQLTAVQVDALMLKYKATYFISRIEHQLDLPQVYQNGSYVLYSRRKP